MKLGDFEIWPLSDGSFRLDGGQMFGVVPKVLWEKKAPADSRNRILMGLNCVLVRAGDQNVVIETGIGDKFDAKFQDIYDIQKSTTLPAEINQHGLALEDIHVVMNSHLHFDHCGWNTRRDGTRIVPTFPRARYYVQRGEWEHALCPTERDRASYIEEFFGAAEPQTEFLEGDQQVIPGIRVEVVAGHNRNIQCVWIESQGEQACFISDLVPTRWHLPYPWIMSFDLYPLETLANKKRLLPQLVERQTLVIFPHDVEMPWATLVECNGKIGAKPVILT
jgi:glyoxylase-like metal-dependent hydrolase (beta-lactamase superfamily II)